MTDVGNPVHDRSMIVEVRSAGSSTVIGAEEENASPASVPPSANCCVNSGGDLSYSAFGVGAFILSVVGTSLATFAALAGGKFGLYFLRGIFETVGFAAVDLSVKANGASSATSLVESLRRAGACWLGIGVLRGTLLVAWYTVYSLKQKPAWNNEDSPWQLEAVVTGLVFSVVLEIGLIAVFMMRAHQDRRPNIFKWWLAYVCSYAVADVGRSSPYYPILFLGSIAYLVVVTFGMYFVVAHVDHNAIRSEVQNGYKLMNGLASWAVLFINLRVASLPTHVLVVSWVMMLFQAICLTIFLPAAKRCYGRDERKLWTYALPSAMLSLELGPCLLYLGEDMRTVTFWLLIIMQESNSVFKNTGKYDELYVAVLKKIGRPLEENDRHALEEARSTIAPCDNAAEIASPIVLLLVILLESAFNMLPAGVPRAPYLAKEGILVAWKMVSNRERTRGEIPMMLVVVLVIRICFCAFEIKTRAIVKRKATVSTETREIERRKATASSASESSFCSSSVSPAVEDDRAVPNSLPQDVGHIMPRAPPRTSIAVLYDRIVHSPDAPPHMKYLAFGLFGLQPVLFVLYAAEFAKILQLD